MPVCGTQIELCLGSKSTFGPNRSHIVLSTDPHFIISISQVVFGVRCRTPHGMDPRNNSYLLYLTTNPRALDRCRGAKLYSFPCGSEQNHTGMHTYEVYMMHCVQWCVCSWLNNVQGDQPCVHVGVIRHDRIRQGLLGACSSKASTLRINLVCNICNVFHDKVRTIVHCAQSCSMMQ